jgi:hypothetical protein
MNEIVGALFLSLEAGIAKSFHLGNPTWQMAQLGARVAS